MYLGCRRMSQDRCPRHQFPDLVADKRGSTRSMQRTQFYRGPGFKHAYHLVIGVSAVALLSVARIPRITDSGRPKRVKLPFPGRQHETSCSSEGVRLAARLTKFTSTVRRIQLSEIAAAVRYRQWRRRSRTQSCDTARFCALRQL
jgi:hypothetical protein